MKKSKLSHLISVASVTMLMCAVEIVCAVDPLPAPQPLGYDGSDYAGCISNCNSTCTQSTQNSQCLAYCSWKINGGGGGE
jgi:hypothetical protein